MPILTLTGFLAVAFPPLLLGLSLLCHALLLVSLGLRLDVVEKTEQLGCLALVECVGELVDGRGDFDALKERHLRTLEANVFRPPHETGKVALWWQNGATNGENAWLLLHSILREFNLFFAPLLYLLHHFVAWLVPPC